ncbi:hypothetical protein ABW19_dt0204875 [Dactylella cylindrospora]|nr:hypothetical protein ABW19_dt0204875 [Dactylella cylindrospora]
MDDVRRINVEWTINAAKTFSSKLLPPGKKFRFIYTSGMLVPDPEQVNQSMWFGEEFRKIRFETDLALVEMAKEGKIDCIIGKPGFITEGEPLLARLFLGTMSVSKQAMAAAYLDGFFNGSEKQLWQNSDLRSIGARALKDAEAEAKK